MKSRSMPQLWHRRVLLVALIAALAVTGRTYAQSFGPIVSIPPPGQPASDRPPILKDVRIDQKLDAPIPADVPFVDETGRNVTIGDYFGKRPVILALVYYECPMLCTLELNGLVSALETINFNAGDQYDVVAVSFDPGETPSLAATKKTLYLHRYGRPNTGAGFHFLTGRQESIARLTDAVGFRYKYDESIDQFAHPAAITILTPTGRVSRYLYGIEYAPRDLRLALVEAADGKIGTFADQALLFCYHYDPLTGKYGFAIMSLVRLGGILTLAALGIFMWSSRRPALNRRGGAGRRVAS